MCAPAVGRCAHDLALVDLGLDRIAANGPHAHATDVIEFVACDMIKVHQERRKFATTISARPPFEIVDPLRQPIPSFHT